MENANEFSSLLRSNSVFFFAGAGISIESGAPSVPQMLTASAQLFLPDAGDLRQASQQIVEGTTDERRAAIQPELFYELVLSVLRKERCIDLWQVLSNDYLRAFGFALEPNVNHLALVAYSASAGVPIFTTNFDGLLEEAANTLGVRCEVVLPYTEREAEICTEVMTSAQSDRPLYIFKLHGTADDMRSIHTTMHSISSKNEQALALLVHLARRLHLTFVGYSGRDVDIFPPLADAADKRGTFWFDPNSDVSGEYIDRIGALSIRELPSEYFMREFPQLATKSTPPSKEKWGKVIEETQAGIRRDVDIQPIDQISILAACLHVTGDNDTACEVFNEYQRDLVAYPDAVKMGISQFYNSKALDSIGKYLGAERVCINALSELEKAGSEDLSSKEYDNLECLMVRLDYQRAFARKQQAGPTIRYRDSRMNWRPGALALLRIAYDYVATLRRMGARLGGLGEARNQLHVIHAKHSYSDHQIVLFAMVLGVLQAIRLDKLRATRYFLAQWLARIARNANDFGDYFSLAGVGKYYSRIGVSGWAEKTMDLYGLITNPLNQALMFRDRGEQALSEGKIREARTAFEESCRLSQLCGSRPTQLKAMIGLYVCGVPMPDLERQLKQLDGEIEGEGYHEYIEYALARL